jgi:catechol 2,3-dioxygenase-like lactoylglutathione lyase family enzyme
MGPTLTHLALHVRDLAACVAFYRDFCAMTCVHERADSEGGEGGRVVWLAEPGRETEFILVVLAGGPGRDQGEGDYSHFGFALESRAAVDAIAEKARAAGCLLWPPREEPYPVGYYCGLSDPDGNAVEFSYGQPLGPGAASGASGGAASGAAGGASGGARSFP